MSHKEVGFGVIWKKFKFHLSMVLSQVAFTCLYFLIEASFSVGMDPHVFVTYRHVVGSVVMFPIAYVLEREARLKLTMSMFLEIFVLSLIGICLTLNMYFSSLKYTSASFVTSMVNTISSLTFIIAVALRLETVDIKNPRGVAKIFGTTLSLGGALTMTMYKGHAIQSLQGAPFHITDKSVHNNWIKGSILAIASCISWSLWYIMQALVVKKYPAQLTLTAWINLIGAAQSAVYSVIVQHKPKGWLVTSGIELCCIIYAGIICCALIIFVQIWTMEQKGPVFVSMFNPLGTVLVAILAYFVFGEQLHMGSVLGGVLVIIGLYLLLWGKEGDQDFKKTKLESFQTHVEQKECETHKEASLEQEVP